MNFNTLDKHLMILLNGPDIKEFNFEKAYEHWKSKEAVMKINFLLFIYLLYLYFFS